MYDWKLAIVTNFWQRQQAEIWWSGHVFPMGAPKVRASDEAIAQAERAANVKFPEDYKDFLRHADGWPGFCEDMDLFATADFLSGDATRQLARHPSAVQFMNGLGFTPSDYVAVGGARQGLDVFLLTAADSSKSPGEVIWYDDEQRDRWPSFSEFFSSMIAFNELLAQKGAEKDPDRGGGAKRYPLGYIPTEFRLKDE
jgi:hypothetical protein